MPTTGWAQGAQWRLNDGTISAITGWKDPVRVATTTAGVLATDFEPGDVVDGVVLAGGDRILIKDQAAGAENGIYEVQPGGGAPVRTADANQDAEVIAGIAVATGPEGTANATEIWLLATADPITVGVTPQTWARVTMFPVQGFFSLTNPGTLVVATDVALPISATQNLTIIKARATVKTAPTGASIIVDVNKNGTSIFAATPANRPTIAAGTVTADSGAPDTTTLADGDDLTIDVDQVGSTIAGADLTVQLICQLVG